MKYKQVHVYTACNENSVQSIDAFEYPDDVQSAGEFVEHNIHFMLDDQGMDLEHIRVFYTGVEVVDGVARVPHGEEMVVLVIPQDHRWYDRVEEDQSTWDNTTKNAWDAFVWCETSVFE